MSRDSAGGPGAAGEPAVLGRGLRVVGRVQGEGDLRVEAQVEGDITVTGALHLDTPGRVTGSIAAESVIVAGLLEGDAEARSTVAITASGRIEGDVRAAGLSLEQGGGFDGRVDADFELPDELC